MQYYQLCIININILALNLRSTKSSSIDNFHFTGSKIDYLLTVVPFVCNSNQVGSPVESFADVTGSPLMLACGPRGKLSRVFVVIEGQTKSVPSLLAALDRAFKVHYMFNVSYNDKSTHVWQLIQKLGFNINDSITTYACVHYFQRFFTVSKRSCLDV